MWKICFLRVELLIMENIVGRIVRRAWGKLLNRISKKKGRTRPGALENTLASICWVDPSHSQRDKVVGYFPFPWGSVLSCSVLVVLPSCAGDGTQLLSKTRRDRQLV